MERPTADLVAFGGNVLTLDSANHVTEGLAIRDGEIVAVGTSRDVLSLAGEQTVRLDLAGRTAIPGLIETHNHPGLAGFRMRRAVDAATPPNDTIADIVERVAERARDLPAGEWVRAEGYDDTLLADRRHPTRWDLDPVSPRNPVYLTHVSGHLAVANSVALSRAGITEDTRSPRGGVIYRDDRGQVTGVLAELTALALVTRHLPHPRVDDLVEDLEAVSEVYVRAGITSVHDTGIFDPEGITAYRAAVATGRFLPRCYAFLTEPLLSELSAGVLSPLEAAVAGFGDERFRLGGVKLWADGSIQGLTGALTEPYACAPDLCGVATLSKDDIALRARVLSEAGWQLAIHGNGDAAIDAIIEGYVAAGAGAAGVDHRFRIEHCQMVREDQLVRMAENGIHASFFEKHVYYWGDRHRDIFIGPERASRISPLRSAERHGIRYGLHSDCPVTPIPPLEGIWAAVNRRTSGGTVLGPQERVSAEKALRAYTSDAAHLSFEEARKGTLEPGKLGDVTVLSADPTAVPATRLGDIRVDTTVIGGKVVWQR